MSFLLRFSLAFCWTAVSFPFFLKLPHALFEKVIARPYSIRLVIQLSKNISELLFSTCLTTHIYSPSLSTLYIGLLKNRRKINLTVKLFLGRLFSPNLLSDRKLFVLSQIFFALLKNGIKNPSRALAREGAYKYLLLYKNKDTV